MKKCWNRIAAFTTGAATCALLMTTASCGKIFDPSETTDPVNPPAQHDTLNVAPGVAAIVFEADATTASPSTFTVAANSGSWNAVASGGSWVRIDMNKTGKTFTISADVNYDAVEPASVTVTVTAGRAAPVKIKVTQKAAVNATCNNVSRLCGRTLFIDDIDETNLPAGERIDSIRIMISPFPAGGVVFLGSAPYVNRRARLTLPETVADKYTVSNYWGVQSAEHGAKSNTIGLYAYSKGSFVGIVKLVEWDAANNKYTYDNATYMYADNGYTLNHSESDYVCQISIVKGWSPLFVSIPTGAQTKYIYTNQPPAGSVFKWRFN